MSNRSKLYEPAPAPLVSLVIPTLRERENLLKIIPEISTLLIQKNWSHEIIIIDDNSRDGSNAVIDSYSKNGINVNFIERKETPPDLGKAILQGFSLSKGEIILLMDADGSHPVLAIPSLIEPILEHRFDITVGSRYIKGGATPDWSATRRVLSRLACFLARGLTTLNDPTSGFIAFRRSSLDLEAISPASWKITLDIASRFNIQILEVPIIFTERKSGCSKLSGKVILKYIKHLGALYHKKYFSPCFPPDCYRS